jgi:hypothetical protein
MSPEPTLIVEPPRKSKPGPAARARARAERAVAAGETPPARATSPGGRRTRLETQVGAMIVQLNLGLTMTCALVPGLDAKEDPLQPNEIVLLARGIAAQAEAHATFRRYLQYLLNVSGSAGLVSVVVAIMTVRLAKHGVLPGEVGAYAQLALMADPAEVKALTDLLTAEEPEAA